MRHLNPSASASRAFTLIEILVVVAIIVVLMAISVPVLSSFRETGKISQTRAMLMSLAGAADEFNISTGTYADHSVGNVQGVAVDATDSITNNTIGVFLLASRSVPGVDNMVKSATKTNYNQDVNGNGTLGESINDLTVLDAWENPIRYTRQVDYSSTTFNKDHYLPAYPRPFFASAGPDGEFGSINNSTGEPDALAADNIYSYESN